MKIGEAINVSVEGGHAVAQAYIEDISDDKVTFVIPATRFVMAIKHSLAVPESDNTERVFGGMVEQRDTTSDASDEVNTPEAPAPVQSHSEVGEGIHNKTLDSSAID